MTADPNLLALPFRGWEAEWGPDVDALIACGLYALGVSRARRWPARRSASFAAGVAVAIVALQSGLDRYDDRLLSAHMIQHMLLLLVAPLLLVAGRPVTLALRALGPAPRRALAGALIRVRPLADPVVCLVVFSLAVIAWHLPVVFEATVHHQTLHALEHASMLAVGMMFWAPLLDAVPGAPRRLNGLGRIVYVIAAMPSMALVGAYLNRAAELVYPSYGPTSAAFGVSALREQARAGAIMWVAGGVFAVSAGIWIAMATMSAEERRLQRAEARAAELAPRLDAGSVGG